MTENVVEIDARGTFCPVPLIETAKAIAPFEARGAAWRAVVLADDPDAPGDFLDWARARGAACEVAELGKTQRKAWRIALRAPSSSLPSCR